MIGKGRFIAFEGIDGCGKSTQIALLEQKLKEQEIPCYVTFEPTDSPIGSVIHQIMTGRIKTDNKVIAALFAADRLDHVLNETNGMIHEINNGVTVISSRYYMSSYAYHSVDMPMDWIITANEPSRDILVPDRNIFIDVDPDTALERIKKNRSKQELFEKRSRLVQTREKYLEAIERVKNRESITIIDGNQDISKIAGDIWKSVKVLWEGE